MKRPRGEGERGDTLVEIMVAVAVLGIGVTALLGALGVMAGATAANRSDAKVEAALLTAAEYAKTMPLTAVQFAACGPAPFTFTTQIALPAGISATLGQGTAAPGAAACSSLLQLPVAVQGDGFSVTLSVVRRP